ncbi:dTMP kinase [Rhodohalobacter mucosus]|uniref:Thymidylate kinase n=1 Tax=Rhodohalobacter mucosus TaxID=2079485 RepID=A0A316TSH0_9BACT|nr:dTMP kinase [Rhodohalobacter mucosus]PWN07573.1 dTMP kinase [Rhodohalobacter mucosus]
MLITFEGIDGCGKSTQIELLKSYLEEHHYPCHVFREPGGTELSEKVRSLLLHDDLHMNPVTEMLLFSSARSELLSEKVIPLLRDGLIVILDRFYDSTTAYQGYGRGSLEIDQIHTLNNIASHAVVPDITFYLKISPQLASERTRGSEKDRMENAGTAFFEKVCKGYDVLAEQEDRIKTVDASQSPQEIHSVIRAYVEQNL